MRIAFLACIAVSVSGCTTLPQKANIDDFGKSVAQVSSALKAEIAANKAIALASGSEKQANEYLQGKSAQALGDDPLYAQTVIPMDKQIKALSALEAYGNALSTAADKGVTDNLEQAYTKLGDAVGNFATIAGPAGAAAKPVIHLVGQSAGYAASSAYASKIRRQIAKADPLVQQLSTQMATDMESLRDQIDDQAGTYEFERINNLDVIQASRSINKFERYEAFKAAKADFASVSGLEAALDDYPEMFDALKKAHAALVKDPGDATQAVQRFATIAGDIADSAKAIKAK